jgi:hypothetical protein
MRYLKSSQLARCTSLHAPRVLMATAHMHFFKRVAVHAGGVEDRVRAVGLSIINVAGFCDEIYKV